eukprot:scaffold776_cov347-Pavlova_lutheri.AAC.127
MLDLPASRVAHPCRRNPRVSTVRLGMIRSSTRMNFQHARASASSTVENKVTKVSRSCGGQAHSYVESDRYSSLVRM